MGATEKTEYYYFLLRWRKFMNEWNQQLKHAHTK